MQLSLRKFLILALLMGAVGLPLAWKGYTNWQQARADSIVKLEYKMEAARLVHLELVATAFDESGGDLSAANLPPPTSEIVRLENHLRSLEDEIEKLTRSRPQQREWEVERTRKDIAGIEYIKGLGVFRLGGPSYTVPRRKLAIWRWRKWGFLDKLGMPVEPDSDGPISPLID